MYLKTKNKIYNLNVGSLYILDVPRDKYDYYYSYCSCEIVYNTSGNPQLTDPLVYLSDRKDCENLLQAIWREMQSKGANAFIDMNNLQYLEEEE
jgi:hypothetical protein